MNKQQTIPGIRHCMIVHNSYPYAETRVQREAEALISQGIEVDIICLRMGDDPIFELVNNVKVHRLQLRRRKGISFIMQLLEYLAFFFLAFWRLNYLYFQKHYSVIQVHNLPDFLVFVAFIPRLMGAKVILDLHDLMPEFYASRFKSDMNRWQVRLMIWQEHLACKFANHVITVSEPWRQTLIERGLAPEKCTVVMNTADLRFFRYVPDFAHSTKGDEFRLIYHGTLAQRYGIDLILRAVSRLRPDLPDLRLTIHGRGEFLDELKRIIQDLGIGDCVLLSTNYMPIEELPALISRANLGIVPYRRDVFTDGILPTKLMEYAVLGIPAVVARTPVITAYFDEGMVKFFQPEDVEDLAECIRALYHDRARLAQMADNIQLFNVRYNWPSQKEGYIKLVQKLAQR